MTEITLKLQYPLTVEHAKDHAQLCVDGAKQLDNIELDYSHDSLDYIDSVIEGWRGENASMQDVATPLFSLGCYLGEVFVRAAEAEWIDPENEEDETFPLLLRLPGGTICRPIDQVFKRFEAPEEGDYLPDFFEDLVAEDSDEEKELVAVLRTLEGSEFEQSVVHKKIADDLAVFACRRIPTESGVLGIDYVLKSQLAESDLDEKQLLEFCYENFFASEIRVNAYEQDGDEMLEFVHEEGLVSAILGHPDSYSRVSEMVKSPEVTVVIVNPDVILAARTGSSFEAGFQKIIDDVKNDPIAIHLRPSIYHWSAGTLTKVSS